MPGMTGNIGDLLLDEAARRKTNYSDGPHVAHRGWVPALTANEEMSPTSFAEKAGLYYFFSTPIIAEGDEDPGHWVPIYEVNTRWKKLRGVEDKPPYFFQHLTVRGSMVVRFSDGSWTTKPSDDPALELFVDHDRKTGEERRVRPEQMVAAACVEPDNREGTRIDRSILLPLKVSEFKALRTWIAGESYDDPAFADNFPGAPIRMWYSGDKGSRRLMFKVDKSAPRMDMTEIAAVDIDEYVDAVRNRFTDWAARHGVEIPPPLPDVHADDGGTKFVAKAQVDRSNRTDGEEAEYEAVKAVAQATAASESKVDTEALSRMTVDELKAKAAEMGIDMPARLQRKAIIALIVKKSALTDNPPF